MYQASKAAVTSFSETLRLELKPFGVKVICLHTGGVKSQIFNNTQASKLPANSLYKSMEDTLRTIVSGEYARDMLMEPDIYAQKVVNDVMNASNGIIWRGAYSSMLAFMASYLPSFVMVRHPPPYLTEVRLERLFMKLTARRTWQGSSRLDYPRSSPIRELRRASADTKRS